MNHGGMYTHQRRQPPQATCQPLLLPLIPPHCSPPHLSQRRHQLRPARRLAPPCQHNPRSITSITSSSRHRRQPLPSATCPSSPTPRWLASRPRHRQQQRRPWWGWGHLDGPGGQRCRGAAVSPQHSSSCWRPGVGCSRPGPATGHRAAPGSHTATAALPRWRHPSSSTLSSGSGRQAPAAAAAPTRGRAAAPQQLPGRVPPPAHTAAAAAAAGGDLLCGAAERGAQRCGQLAAPVPLQQCGGGCHRWRWPGERLGEHGQQG